jgi:flagellar assembly factor FliW
MTTIESAASPGSETFTRQVVYLPFGLLGFERIKRYVLLSRAEEAPFSWLQAPDDPSLNFLVLPPFLALADYQPSFAAEDVEALELTGPEDALLYGIVTLQSKRPPTINLKGPILVNRHTWRGKQAILTNAAVYSLRHPLPVSDTCCAT